MHRRWLLLTLFCAALLIAPPFLFAEDEDEDDSEQGISLKNVPAKVKAAAMKAGKGIKLTEAEVEAALIYELEGTANGKRYEITVTGEGKVIGKEMESDKDDDDEDDDDKDDKDDEDKDDEDEAEHELEIPLSAVPKKVKTAAMKAVKGIKLSEAEVEAVLVYEVEGKVGKKEVELEITADGRVLEMESEKDDDDKDDDKDDDDKDDE